MIRVLLGVLIVVRVFLRRRDGTLVGLGRLGFLPLSHEQNSDDGKRDGAEDDNRHGRHHAGRIVGSDEIVEIPFELRLEIADSVRDVVEIDGRVSANGPICQPFAHFLRRDIDHLVVDHESNARDVGLIRAAVRQGRLLRRNRDVVDFGLSCERRFVVDERDVVEILAHVAHARRVLHGEVF